METKSWHKHYDYNVPMKFFRLIRIVSVCVMMVITLTGCFTWNQGWKGVQTMERKGDTSALIAQANRQMKIADTQEKLADLIGIYEKVLEIDPANYEALWSLGRYNLLMGYAYADSVKSKKEYYLKAMQACERGMYTNSEFKKLVDGGMPVWDASSVLTIREIASIYYWYASLGMYYSECMNPMEKILNLSIGKKNKKMIASMMAINPAWGGGHPYTAWAVYYAILPSFMGGDLKKSAEYFAKADQVGARWLYVRFQRARYLHAKTKNWTAYRKDLEWVIAQNPHTALSPYPWNVYFQREAKKLLDQQK